MLFCCEIRSFGALIFGHRQNLEFLATRPFFRSLLRLSNSLHPLTSERLTRERVKAVFLRYSVVKERRQAVASPGPNRISCF